MQKNAIEEVIFYIKHYSLPLSILLTCDAWLSVVTDFEALASFYTWFQKFAEVVSLVYDVKWGCEVNHPIFLSIAPGILSRFN